MTEQAKLRALALALLNSGQANTRKSGQFLGGLVGEPSPLSPKQFEWLQILSDRGGMSEQFAGIDYVAE